MVPALGKKSRLQKRKDHSDSLTFDPRLTTLNSIFAILILIHFLFWPHHRTTGTHLNLSYDLANKNNISNIYVV